MVRKITQEIFEQETHERTDHQFDLSKAIWVSAKTKVLVVCKDGHEFLATPNNLQNGRGCSVCAKINKGKTQVENQAKTFLDRCKAKAKRDYDFSLVTYKGMWEHVTVICPKHDKFDILAVNLTKGQGCRKCAHEGIGLNSRLDREEFFSKVEAANAKYKRLTDSVYDGYEVHVKMSCTEHGEFKSKPGTLLHGVGCPGCSVYGYRSNRAGYFYVFKFGDIYKIGITNRKPKDRLKSISKSSGKVFIEVLSYKFDIGLIAQYIEKTLLKELKQEYLQPTEVFDGCTECFYNVDQDKLIARIEELTEEHKWQSSTPPQILEECA